MSKMKSRWIRHSVSSVTTRLIRDLPAETLSISFHSSVWLCLAATMDKSNSWMAGAHMSRSAEASAAVLDDGGVRAGEMWGMAEMGLGMGVCEGLACAAMQRDKYAVELIRVRATL